MTGSKSMDWFLYDNGLRHERVKKTFNYYSTHYINMNLGFYWEKPFSARVANLLADFSRISAFKYTKNEIKKQNTGEKLNHYLSY